MSIFKTSHEEQLLVGTDKPVLEVDVKSLVDDGVVLWSLSKFFVADDVDGAVLVFKSTTGMSE